MKKKKQKKNKKNHIAKCKHRLRTSGVPYCYNSDGHIVGTLRVQEYYCHDYMIIMVHVR